MWRADRILKSPGCSLAVSAVFIWGFIVTLIALACLRPD